MKHSLALALALAAGSLHAAPGYTGPDLSGTYDCTGQDAKEGAYTGVVTLALIPERSHGPYASYDFRLDVPGYGAYPGHAAANGRDMAIHFANTDPAARDYGTGIARFSRDARGRWRFVKFYHEPEYQGGNTGTERCTQRR